MKNAQTFTRLSLTLLLLTFSFLLSHLSLAQTANWTQDHANSRHNNYVGGTFRIIRPQISWSYPDTFDPSYKYPSIFGRNETPLNPNIATDNQHAYCSQTSSGFQFLHALDIKTGKKVWSHRIFSNDKPISAPTIAANKIWVHRPGSLNNLNQLHEFYQPKSYDGYEPLLLSYSPKEGKELSVHHFVAYKENHRPIANDNFVLLHGSGRNGLTVHHTKDGTLAYTIPIFLREFNPLIHNNQVIVKNLNSFNIKDGSSIQTPFDNMNDQPPIVSPNNTILFPVGNILFAYNALTHKKIWNAEVESEILTLSAGNNTIVITGEKSITKLDEKTGKVLLHRPSKFKLGNQAVLTDSHFFINNQDGIHVFELNKLKHVWSTTIKGNPIVSNNYLFISNRHHVHAFSLDPENNKSTIKRKTKRIRKSYSPRRSSKKKKKKKSKRYH